MPDVDDLRLSPEQLRRRCDPAGFGFATTEEVAPLEETIGQPRALNAVGFGLKMEAPGYHVFVTGPIGTGPFWNVCDGLIRLSSGKPPRDDEGIATVRFELWPTAHRFAAGNRVRVQVSSGAHPRYARNPGTGEDPLRATRLVAAEQEIFHDSVRPSSVTLNVVWSGATREA